MMSFDFGFCLTMEGMKEEGINPLSPSSNLGSVEALIVDVENQG